MGRPWRVSLLRAINPDGSLLWPEVANLEEYQAIWESGGHAYFQAIWMQDPSGLAGEVFNPEWFQDFAMPYTTAEQPSTVNPGRMVTLRAAEMLREGLVQAILPDIRELESLQAHDLAIKQKETSDFYARVNGYVGRDGALYVHEVRQARLSDLKMIEDMVLAGTKYRCRAIGIESTGFQSLLFQQASREHPLPFIELDAAGRDKVLRARPLADHFERRKVFLLYGARWNAMLRYQLMEFPGGAHDDLTDALAYMFEMSLGYSPGQLAALASAQEELRKRLNRGERLSDAVGT